MNESESEHQAVSKALIESESEHQAVSRALIESESEHQAVSRASIESESEHQAVSRALIETEQTNTDQQRLGWQAWRSGITHIQPAALRCLPSGCFPTAWHRHSGWQLAVSSCPGGGSCLKAEGPRGHGNRHRFLATAGRPTPPQRRQRQEAAIPIALAG